MIQTITHPVAGQVAMAGVPIKMSRTQGEIRKSSPMLGEHQRDVLLDWLGVDIDKNS
jgi:crotonobetainyl-CoA:carnitine CoA-transferase CaiB-like acyl-CoA transferase